MVFRVPQDPPASRVLVTSLDVWVLWEECTSPLLYNPTGRASGVFWSIDRQQNSDLFRDVHTMTVNSDTTSATPAPTRILILDHFADLADPRREQGRIHQLDEIVFIATCACSAAPIFGYRSRTMLTPRSTGSRPSSPCPAASLLTTPSGGSSVCSTRRLQKCFSSWMTALMSGRVDSRRRGFARTDADRHRRQGPTPPARGTVGQSALHVASAWAIENDTWGRWPPTPNPTRLRPSPSCSTPDLTGAVVTIDAMGCRGKHRRQDHRPGWRVRASHQGEPTASLRGHPAGLRRSVGSGLARGGLHRVPDRRVRSGRQETRSCCVITNPEGDSNAGLWVGPTAIVMVISHRVVNGEASSENRYFIGTLTGRRSRTWVGYVVIGGSRTRCIGCWTSASARMTNGTGLATAKEIGVAPQAGVVSAQGGEEQQGQEYRHAPLGCGLEERLSLGCTGQIPEKSTVVAENPKKSGA